MFYWLLSKREVILDGSTPFAEIFHENCFQITLKAVRTDESTQITVHICPEFESGYKVLVSFVVVINDAENWVDYDLWDAEETVFDVSTNADKLTLGFGMDVHEVLVPRNLHVREGFRKLRILSSNAEYFVNGADLKEIGGSLFQGWYNRESVGETTIVATELSEEELDALLTACCAYSSIIISRRNFETLLPIAWKYKITAVLRAIEQYLLNSKGIHVISKLEFAYKCKFAMLASNVMIGYLLFIPTVFILLVVWRWFRHYGSLNRNRSKDSQNVALIILGSGGHTMEMLKLMNGVCQRFSSRVYVTSDELSKKKAIDFESSQNVLTPNIVFTTRSRHVGQSLLASILPTLIAFFEALWIVASKRPNLILCNGPSTCVPVCFAAFIWDTIRLIDCRIIYVESVCRVKSLSLSGKIIYYTRIYDGFLIQWPELQKKFNGTTYLGRFS